jgi:AraC-like DNA-binding protein
VGASLRPAGIAALHPAPRRLLNAEVPLDAADLHAEVCAAMARADQASGREAAVLAGTRWAARHLTAPDESGLLANTMEELIAADRSIVRIDQVARHLGTSTRGVQRLARRYVGLTPLAVIRRYRLQEAARRLREEPTLTVARVAADLGYADQAHLSADFRRFLGFTPTAYRRDPS